MSFANSPNRKAVAPRLIRRENDATALRLIEHFSFVIPGSRANPGLEGATALRLEIERNHRSGPSVLGVSLIKLSNANAQ